MSASVKHQFSAQVTAPETDIESRNDVPVTLRYLVILNTTVAVAYLQLFNKPASAVTLGSTAPTLSIGLPASSAMVFPVPESGLFMGGGGLCAAGTTTRTGSTGAALDINLGYES
jgi:hypothetical protein